MQIAAAFFFGVACMALSLLLGYVAYRRALRLSDLANSTDGSYERAFYGRFLPPAIFSVLLLLVAFIIQRLYF